MMRDGKSDGSPFWVGCGAKGVSMLIDMERLEIVEGHARLLMSAREASYLGLNLAQAAKERTTRDLYDR